MVTGLHCKHVSVWIVALAICLATPIASAEVVASVDRDRVESNESFNLNLKVDSVAGLTPDLSVLDQDFHVGSTSRLSEASIINGQVQRSMSWTITLTPKRAGTLTIPPVSVGAEQSNELIITVTEPTYEPPGEADVFITADVEFDESYVQAQVLYTIKVYRAVATRQPVLREPVFSGAEVLVEVASDERNYESVLNGRAYSVAERVYAIFPQESGEISISPMRFEARVLRDGRITGRKVFESEARTIKVNPIPAPPADYPDAAWLPAKEVVLVDDWSREPGELRAGEPISRNITVSALGQLQTQIPVIEPPVVDGVNIYPDRPVLSRRLEAGGIRGMRTDQYAMIGVNGGEVTLPKLELPWFDINTNEWKVARLPARTLTIKPPPAAANPEPVVEPPVAAENLAPDTAREPPVQSDFWRRVAEILAFVWVLTVFAWWWSHRPRRELREPAPMPLHKQQAKLLKAARKAALAEDAAGLRQALLAWAALEWPERTPRSIGELARRVSEPLAAELMRLSRASYGGEAAGWDGAAMAKALRSFAKLEEGGVAARKDLLPPLMPS